MKNQICHTPDRRRRNLLMEVILVTLIFTCPGFKIPSSEKETSSRIQPYTQNPAFWQYKNHPILLMGASSDHNLFQHEPRELLDELDRLVANGGNYLRNTLSFRGPGRDVFAFYRESEAGLFDLNQFNDYYWEKLDFFLQETQKRNIIVQVEVWETYDFYSRGSHVLDGKTAWERNPFNPLNNSNYDYWASGLSELFQSNGQALINPFFNTVLPIPEPFDFTIAPMVLDFQQRFVDKLLSVTLSYDHVLYCMNNETQADPKWSLYWAQYIRKKATDNGIDVEITDMFDPFDPSGGKVQGAIMQSLATHFFTLRSNVHVTLNDPVNFSFVDISNHNAQVGEVHYNTGYYVWKRIQDSGVIRPLNNVKIYGSDAVDWVGSAEEGKKRFWRNVFSGAASVRFHRPGSGLGSSDIALVHVKSMRMLTGSVDVFTTRPSNYLLGNREENEAFCLANDKREAILYFPDGGEVILNMNPGAYIVQWLDIENCTWMQPEEMLLPASLKTPESGHWGIVVKMDSLR
jgi:hypothetical protein